MQKYFYIFILIFISSKINAQENDTIFYYNHIETKKVLPEDASIIAIIKKEADSLFHRKSYYVFSKTLATIGNSYDFENNQKEGEQLHYYENGMLEKIGHYSNGKKNGLFVSYYPDGTMKDSSVYILDIPIGKYNSWHMNGNPEIVANFDTLGKGNGVFVSFFPNGKVSCKGRFDFGLRKVGQWNYYYTNGNKASILVYPKTNESKNGNFVFLDYDPLENFYYDSSQHYTSITCFDSYGVQTDSIVDISQIPAFGKNNQVWENYILNSLHNKARYYKVTGVLSYDMYFTINEEGRVTDVQIGNKLEPELDYYIKNMIKSSGKWKPAIRVNRPIPFVNTTHLSFTIKDL